MRTLLIILFFISHPIFAQLQLPDWSPRATISQDIGYTKFEIQYGRPAARERKIFGELVPYKKLWRTGAGKSTWISFNTEVIINGKPVPAGAYAFVTIPGEKEWTVMLNADTSKLYGDPSEYDVTREALRMTVKPEKTGHFYEALTIYLDSKMYDDAEFYLAWENTRIHFPIATRSHEKTLAIIESTLKKNPNDVHALSDAAFYYAMTNGDPDQTMRWLNKALSIREERWLYHQKINLLEKTKNYSEARKTAAKAIVYLNRDKPDNDGWEYSVKEFEEKLKTWPE